MVGIWSDLVFAARVLRRSRGFTIIAVSSLALAIGANSTIFSVGKQLLFDRLDVPHASSLRLLAATGLSYPVYEQLRAQNTALGDLLVFHATAANATVGDNAERVLLHEVSGNYYEVLGVRAQIGREIRPSDDTPGSAAVAMISDAFWTREFARSPAAIGQSMKINDVPVTIIGVNPQGFTGAASTLPSETPAVLVTLAKATLVTPASNGRNWLANPAAGGGGFIVLGRAKPGVSDRTAQTTLDAQFATIVRTLVPMRVGDPVPSLVLRDGSRGLFAQHQAFATPIAVLMMFLGLVLLLACANIATLMLARGARRQREMGVRLALGAGRGRILRQMLVESLLLATIGGLSGLALAYAGRGAIAQYTPHFDWQVFGFTAAITIVTGLLFGFAPAFAALRTEIADSVKRRHAVGRSVVGFQIALATLLVIAAGLFIRSLAGLTSVNPGFRTDHLLLAQIVLPQNRYPAGANVAFHQRMEQAIAAIPAVASVAGAEAPYLSGEQLETTFLRQGEALDASRNQAAPYNAVGVDFFNTLGIPMLAGRPFNERDTGASPKVAVINQRLAATRFPHENPIGRLVSVGVYSGYGDILSAGPLEIVGVCGDTLYENLHEAPSPQLFIPYAQQTQVRRLTYMIRTQVAPETIVPALRKVLHAADPALPLVAVRTQQAQIDEDLADERLLVSVSTIFGVLALVLASVGIYGVMALSVAQRTREIGIRMALGAVPRQILAMVLREASSLSVIAIAAGVGASIVSARFMKSVLFGIASSDPVTRWSAAGLLLIVALGASCIPARRAAHVHPMDALRRE
jgi:predicted permease